MCLYDTEHAPQVLLKREFAERMDLSSSITFYSHVSRPPLVPPPTSPYRKGVTQHVIPSVLAPSYDADGKSLDESSKIGVMNQSYSWPR